MRRNNMVQQFVGEPDPYSEGANAEGIGYEQVEFDIKCGTLSVVVPADTLDDDVLNEPRLVHIKIETMDGQKLEFEINHGDNENFEV